MTIAKTTDDLFKIRKLQKEYTDYLVETIESWATVMENYPAMSPTVISSMKEMATNIKKITGVKLEDEP